MRRGERGKIKKKYGGRLKSYTVGVKLVSCKMLILYMVVSGISCPETILNKKISR